MMYKLLCKKPRLLVYNSINGNDFDLKLSSSSYQKLNKCLYFIKIRSRTNASNTIMIKTVLNKTLPSHSNTFAFKGCLKKHKS